MNITIDTSTTRLDIAPRLPELSSFGNLLNAKDSFAWLHENPGFSGWTYSLNPRVWTLLQPKQLIVDRYTDPANSRIRVASACHIKCYFTDSTMLIGSFNLTAPTIEDLSVLVKDRKAVAHMKKQFKLHWKYLA